MKNDDILDAMQNIDQQLVEQTDKARKKRKGKPAARVLAFSAAAVAVVFCAAFAFSVLPQKISELTYSRYAVAKAVYPAQSAYPSDFALNRSEKMDKWREEKDVRDTAAENISEQAGEFFSLTTREFLSEAQNENRIYSPVSLYVALAMLAQSTSGSTQEQALNVLGAQSVQQAASVAGDIWNAAYIDDGVAKTLLANSLWVDDSVKIDKSAAETLAQSFRASVFTGDMESGSFANALSAWISEQTGGLINSKITFSENELCELVSTLYYEANWYDEFNISKNETLAFHSPNGDIDAAFMYEYDSSGTYFYGNTFGAVSKGLKHGGTMTFILPDEGIGIDEVLADEDFSEFVFSGDSYSKKKEMRVKLHVPKFDVSSDIELSQGLKTLGLTEAFENGDFSALLPNESDVGLSGVKQSARVTMDEQGVSAAAVIRMPMSGAAAPPEDEIELYFNRPFIFVITSETGLPLFIGAVYIP